MILVSAQSGPPREPAKRNFVEVFKKVQPSVVRIDTNTRKYGSGVIVDDEGLVLTNYHVVAGIKAAVVRLHSGERLKVLGFVATNASRDLALLAIAPLKHPRAIKFAREMPDLGEEVAAIGNPAKLDFSVSGGIVSGFRAGQQVRDLMEQDEFDRLGYDLETKWIQHTAAISHGSSGGPLVNMDGQLLGLNTWKKTNAESLNFAIGVLDIRQLLDDADLEVSPSFQSLPTASDDNDDDAAPARDEGTTGLTEVPSDVPDKSRSPDSGPPKPHTTEPAPQDPQQKLASENETLPSININDPFPSGHVFPVNFFDSGPMLNGNFNREDPSLVVVRYADGKPYAAVNQQRGRLHGVVMGRHENDALMLYATYFEGSRHGVLKSWDSSGNPVLFGQYRMGKRHGFMCYFDSGEPVMLMEYELDRLKCLRVVAEGKVKAEFRSVVDADKDPVARKLLNRLKSLEEEFFENEKTIKLQVKETDLDRRLKIAKRLSVEKRANAQARENQRGAADAAFLHDIAGAATSQRLHIPSFSVPAK